MIVRSRILTWGSQGAFVLLWLAIATLVVAIGERYRYTADWTANGRNSLSAPSVAIVKALRGPVRVDAFVHGGAKQRAIRALIAKYRRVDPRIRLTFVNPNKHPARVRRVGITFNGELQIHYGKRAALVLSPTEIGITNQLARLERTGLQRITFLTGNGERGITNAGPLGLSSWAHQLRARGLRVTTFDIASGHALTPAAGVLVIADPRAPFLAGERKMLVRYLASGGSLLWLFEPGHTDGLGALMRPFGIGVRTGFAVDPTSSLLTGESPGFIAVTHYPNQDLVRGMHLVTVFPSAAALTLKPVNGVKATPILQTDSGAWVQHRPLKGLIRPKPGTKTGALTLGVALTRPVRPSSRQRIVAIGDSDFVSNAYLGEGGNMTLAMNAANWLTHDDAFINVPNRPSPDLTLILTAPEEDVITFGFLVILPLAFAGLGIATWWRRRRL